MQRASSFVYFFPCGIKHSMLEKDRLGNPNIDFPIAAAYGDQDFMSSDNAAEDVIPANVHY